MNGKTDELIATLGASPPAAPWRSPRANALRACLALACYTGTLQAVIGVRRDLLLQAEGSLFGAEAAALSTAAFSAAAATAYSCYPDHGGAGRALRVIPWAAAAAAFVGFPLLRYFFPDARMKPFVPGAHMAECSVFIACAALPPAFAMFRLAGQGASVRPESTGALAVLSAAAAACLTLRLHEAVDDPLHLACWHYAPAVLCAALGAWVGRKTLKW